MEAIPSLHPLPESNTGGSKSFPLFFVITTMDTTKLLSRNIRFHLFRTDLTLRDVAETAGISPYSLGRVASGKTKLIDPNLITDLMRVFKCDANALLMPIEGVPYNEGSQT